MLRTVLGASLAISASAFGQTSASAPAFEVATIKPNRSGQNSIGGRGICTTRAGVSVSNIPLSNLIEQAYGVKEFQLLGRPAWLTSDRFDIEARPASPVPYDQCLLMVQSLMADRFGLRLHRETRQMTVYKLLVAKGGPKLRKLEPGAPLGIKTFSTIKGQLITRGNSMPQLAGMLAITGEVENLVVDETGLDGNYEFTLQWTPFAQAAEGTPGPSLFTALQEQLGLKLQAGKGPVEVLVIDHIERVPTEN